MEKLKCETKDLTQENIEKIGKLFPNCITERKNKDGKLEKAIDMEMLAQMLSKDIVNPGDEAYEFTWVGKKEAMIEANKPIRKTLRPCKEESKDWDKTENLYIEGDNLEVLKLLQESYLNSIKMIYIDPPYNKNGDFIYNDDFKKEKKKYKDETGEIDEDGNRMFKNSDYSGTFHSDWCTMIYSRLMLARNLLSEDGVIFISIDDKEIANLRKMCDEIFGETGFVSEFVWEKKKKPSFLNENIGSKTEYVLAYSKNRSLLGSLSVDVTEKGKKYPLNNAGNPCKKITFPPKTVFFNMDDCIVEPQDMSEGKIITKLLTKLEIKNGFNVNEFSLLGEWRYSQSKIDEIISQGDELTISKIPFRPNHIKKGGEIKKIHNLLTRSTYNVGTNEDATEEQTDLFGNVFFDYTKPVGLLHFFIKSCTFVKKDSIVLDFFSGSATTAQAVMDLNAEDGGNRKFIMVQYPEKTDEKSEAYKAGYKNICEIGKERIRRAGEKVKEENTDKDGIENLDTGFRVLKVDDTNMKDVYYTPTEYTQSNLYDLVSNIKEDRTDLDLLFGCLIEWGLPLNRNYESKDIDGSLVHIYNNGDLIACFDGNISEEAVKEIAKMKPLRVVFRDSSFRTSAEKINVEEIFKLFSPDTSVRII